MMGVLDSLLNMTDDLGVCLWLLQRISRMMREKDRVVIFPGEMV